MNIDLLLCANCGKGEDESVALKNCVACKMVKYCGRDCQKAHRPQHKNECRLRAAELHDEELFKQPPLNEECPICFLTLPWLETGKRYQSCCGKIICSGCIHAGVTTTGKNMCPFCRALAPKSDEEVIKRMQKRVEMGDAEAIRNLGGYYVEGIYGLPQDWGRSLELWHRAAELGYTTAYHSIGLCYYEGRGVERDEMKAKHYWELAAMGGNTSARYNLGIFEERAENYNRALKHYMISVGSGSNDALKRIKQMFSNGHATKDDYSKALLSYQSYLGEIKSDQRDKTAEYSVNYKYYE